MQYYVETSQYFTSKNCNLGKNIWNEIGKSSKIEQDKKSLISTFVCFLTAIAKV